MLFRKTPSANTLVELGPGTTSKVKFGDALHSTLGESATVCCMEPKVTVKIWDLYELTIVKEVTAAVNSALGER